MRLSDVVPSLVMVVGVFVIQIFGMPNVSLSLF